MMEMMMVLHDDVDAVVAAVVGVAVAEGSATRGTGE
jgi:hypothetical protein